MFAIIVKRYPAPAGPRLEEPFLIEWALGSPRLFADRASVRASIKHSRDTRRRLGYLSSAPYVYRIVPVGVPVDQPGSFRWNPPGKAHQDALAHIHEKHPEKVV